MLKHFLISLELVLFSYTITAQKLDTSYFDFKENYYARLLEVKKIDSDYSVFNKSFVRSEYVEIKKIDTNYSALNKVLVHGDSKNKMKQIPIQSGYVVSYKSGIFYRTDVSYFIINPINPDTIKKMVDDYYNSLDRNRSCMYRIDESFKESKLNFLSSMTVYNLDEYIDKKGARSEVFISVTPTLIVRIQFFKKLTYKEGVGEIYSSDRDDFSESDLDEFIEVKNKFLELFTKHLLICRNASAKPKIATQIPKYTPQQMPLDETLKYSRENFEIKKTNVYQSEGYYIKKDYVEYIQNVEVKSKNIEDEYRHENTSVKKVLKFYPDKATFKIINTPDYLKVFAKDKNGIYFKGKRVTADTHLILPYWDYDDKYIWKTKTNVFVNDHAIKVKDVFSFRPRSNNYQTDIYSIYYNTVKIEGSHGASFEYVNNQICYDKNNVYLNQKPAFYNGLKLIPINGRLAKTDNAVVEYSDTFLNVSEKANFDIKTLVGLSENFAKDKNNLYFGSNPTPLTTKKLINLKIWDQYNSHYFSDGEKVYYSNGREVHSPRGDEFPIDASTFGIFPKSDIYYDKNGIYDRLYNPNFILPFSYSKAVSDSTSFICYSWVIYLNQAFNRETKRKYQISKQEIIQLRKGNSKEFDERVAKLEKSFYNEDIYSFNDTIFYQGEYTTIDFPTFKQVADFFIDKNHIYNYSKKKGLVILDSVDRASFKEFKSLGGENGENKILWTDKNYLHYDTTRLLRNIDLKIIGGYTQHSINGWCGNEPRWFATDYLVTNKDGKWIIRYFSGNEYCRERTKLTINKVME